MTLPLSSHSAITFNSERMPAIPADWDLSHSFKRLVVQPPPSSIEPCDHECALAIDQAVPGAVERCSAKVSLHTSAHASINLNE